jgi:hypothetical protein
VLRLTSSRTLFSRAQEQVMREKEANRAEFVALLADAKLTARSTFPLFRSRHCRDPRFKSVPIVKDQVCVRQCLHTHTHTHTHNTQHTHTHTHTHFRILSLVYVASSLNLPECLVNPLNSLTQTIPCSPSFLIQSRSHSACSITRLPSRTFASVDTVQRVYRRTQARKEEQVLLSSRSSTHYRPV